MGIRFKEEEPEDDDEPEDEDSELESGGYSELVDLIKVSAINPTCESHLILKLANFPCNCLLISAIKSILDCYIRRFPEEDRVDELVEVIQSLNEMLEDNIEDEEE